MHNQTTSGYLPRAHESESTVGAAVLSGIMATYNSTSRGCFSRYGDRFRNHFVPEYSSLKRFEELVRHRSPFASALSAQATINAEALPTIEWESTVNGLRGTLETPKIFDISRSAIEKVADLPGLTDAFSAIEEYFYCYNVESKIKFDVVIDYIPDPECRCGEEFEVRVTPSPAMSIDDRMALWDELSESLHRHLASSRYGDRFYISMEF